MGVMISCDREPKVRLIKNKIINSSEIKKNDTTVCKFSVLNVGDKPLFILNAKGDCNCMKVEWTKTGIMKGDTGYVKVGYYPKVVGKDIKTVVFETNTNPPFNVLTIESLVKE